LSAAQFVANNDQVFDFIAYLITDLNVPVRLNTLAAVPTAVVSLLTLTAAGKTSNQL
jgi:hypothetical protein